MRTDPRTVPGRRRTPGWRVVVTLALAAALSLVPATARAATGPALTVDVTAPGHAIAPEIYGMSYADPQLADELDLPVNRWGGNYTDRYNWRLDAWNTGRDWYFENVAGCWNEAGGYCSRPPAVQAQAYRRIIDGDRATGAQTLLTLPMVGSVAGSVSYSQPLPCSFPTPASGQDSYDPFAGCGNGRVGGRAIAMTHDVGTPSTPQTSADWIADISGHYGPRAVRFYGLGNEPALWHDTHRDVHPQRTTYDELLSKSVALAKAVKTADPFGRTLGLSEWGWPNYFCSAADGAPETACSETAGAGLRDRAAHGGQPLVTWFLDQMKAVGASDGRRLLDYLDLHYYAQGGWDADVTRSLWDPSYTDPSWIGERIQLLPRMHRWVDDHYPGTKLALSEYDLSLGDPENPTTAEKVTDTLIQADTLGILARERVDLAARWSPPAHDDFEANAFRLYRDYDGAGGRFGATWAASSSADQARLAVYGATRSADGALTIALVNKSAQPLTSPLALTGVGAASAQAWQWNGAAPDARPQRIADVAVSGGQATVTVPAQSLTLLVVPGVVRPVPDPGDPDPVDPGPGQPTTPTTPTPTAPAPPAPPVTPAPTKPGGSRPQTPLLPLADRVGLPAATRCVRPATLKFRIRSPTARRLRSARVALGRRSIALSGRGLSRPVVLRGLPRRGAFTIQVRLRLVGEQRPVVAQRRYRRCS